MPQLTEDQKTNGRDYLSQDVDLARKNYQTNFKLFGENQNAETELSYRFSALVYTLLLDNLRDHCSLKIKKPSSFQGEAIERDIKVIYDVANSYKHREISRSGRMIDGIKDIFIGEPTFPITLPIRFGKEVRVKFRENGSEYTHDLHTSLETTYAYWENLLSSL